MALLGLSPLWIIATQITRMEMVEINDDLSGPTGRWICTDDQLEVLLARECLSGW